MVFPLTLSKYSFAPVPAVLSIHFIVIIEMLVQLCDGLAIDRLFVSAALLVRRSGLSIVVGHSHVGFVVSHLLDSASVVYSVGVLLSPPT